MAETSAQLVQAARIEALGGHHIYDAAARMRRSQPGDSFRTARLLGEVVGAWRRRDFAPRREMIAAIGAAWGYSEPLLDSSTDALLAPFTDDSMRAFAANFAVNQGEQKQHGELIGMVMPGNLPGAGLHEVILGLLSGKGLILKTSAAEPFFFAAFEQTIRQFDETLGNRMAVFNWDRDSEDMTAALRASCDWLVAFGDDETMQHFEAEAGRNNSGREQTRQFRAGFGRRFSGAYVGKDGAAEDDARGWRAVIDAFALDISLFEQAGCLSPHHIFVEERKQTVGSSDRKRSVGKAYNFAASLASALERIRVNLTPPSRIGLETAAALRRVRESARWRAIGGESVAIWEGERLGWTVIYDEDAIFTPSPGYRTVTVSSVRDADDMARCLAEVNGRLEAFALAGSNQNDVRRCLTERGASYLCAPGKMQSPPLTWRHGGGQFLDALMTIPRVRDE